MIPPNQMIERALDRDAASMNFDWVFMADCTMKLVFSLLLLFLGDKRLEYDEIN